LLQAGKLADQGLERGLGVVEQHDADGPDHTARIVAQRQAADHKGAGLVGQQVDQDRLAGLQHTAHLGVVDHILDAVAQELVDRRKTQGRQKAPIPLIDPHDAPAAVHQEHALADARKQVEHRLRRQGQDAVTVQRQGIG